VFVAATADNILTARNVLVSEAVFRDPNGQWIYWPLAPMPGADLAKGHPYYGPANNLPAGSRIMLVGEARGFYYPPGTIYATAFDAQPLAAMIDDGLSPSQIMERLRQMGVTHIWVNWGEIWRLAGTYGFPRSLSAELYDRWQSGRPPGLKIFDQLGELGLSQWSGPPAMDVQPATTPVVTATTMPATLPASRKWDPFQPPRHWPATTVYVLPADHPPDDHLP
jgi:hypothetical protein